MSCVCSHRILAGLAETIQEIKADRVNAGLYPIYTIKFGCERDVEVDVIHCVSCPLGECDVSLAYYDAGSGKCAQKPDELTLILPGTISPVKFWESGKSEGGLYRKFVAIVSVHDARDLAVIGRAPTSLTRRAAGFVGIARGKGCYLVHPAACENLVS